jgi:ribosome biogenesis GTPase A
MKKAERLIQANISLVDGIVEIIDARIPFSSRSLDLEKFLKKPKLIILSKSDLADTKVTKSWIEYFSKSGIPAISVNSKNGNGTDKFLPVIRKQVLAELVERRALKGLKTPLRLMVVGIPNVGKSAFINRITKSKFAKVEDRPGVTRAKQWVKLADDAELLDMPGILAPKYENQEIAKKLAFVGSVKDEILDLEGLTADLLFLLKEKYSAEIISRYGILIEENDSGFDIMCKIARKRGMLLAGGVEDLDRTSKIVIDEFRGGKIGRISLENPYEEE